MGVYLSQEIKMQKIPVPKEDYRTNRADYLIAKSPKAEPKASKSAKKK